MNIHEGTYCKDIQQGHAAGEKTQHVHTQENQQGHNTVSLHHMPARFCCVRSKCNFATTACHCDMSLQHVPSCVGTFKTLRPVLGLCQTPMGVSFYSQGETNLFLSQSITCRKRCCVFIKFVVTGL